MIQVPAEKYSSFVPITGELFNPLEGWNIISKKKIKLIEEGGKIYGYYLYLVNFKQIIELPYLQRCIQLLSLFSHSDANIFRYHYMFHSLNLD